MLPVAGTVPTSKGVLYTVPTGARSRITKIVVDNEGGDARTIKLYVTVNTVEVGLSPSVVLNDGDIIEDSGETWLAAGNCISGESTGSGCHFFISGEEV